MANLGLQNGAAQLAPWFVDIRLDRYEDALHVTEVEALLRYIASNPGGSRGVADRLDRAGLTRYLIAELAQYGAIHISKETGMFLARRP